MIGIFTMTVATEQRVYAEYGRTLIIRPSAEEDANELFEKVCADFDEHTRIEQDTEGNVHIMPPTGGESADRNSEITLQLRGWSKKDGRGRCFDSNVLFKLPDGSKLGPDGSWVSNEKLAALSRADRRSFLRLVPEFVIELKSPTDSFARLQRKMEDWMRNGVELGWLIHPDKQTVLIYRNDRVGPEFHESSAGTLLAADGPIKGFVLDLEPIWTGLTDL